MALAWIKEFIDNFGGDPDKVILWGQSAGSLSITTHLATHPDRDDTPFRGVMMVSCKLEPDKRKHSS